MLVTCDEEGVRQMSLHRRRGALQRLDVGPFVAVYALLGGLYASGWEPSALRGSPDWLALFWLAMGAGSVLAHAVTLLVGFWSVPVRALLRYAPAGWDSAEVVCVLPAAHHGAADLCTLRRVSADADSSKAAAANAGGALNTAMPRLWFEFQREKYGCAAPGEPVRKIECPVALTFAAYADWRGHRDAAALADAETKWGKNEFAIPLPTLQELFVEHALAPFFIFQVLCVALWCLDEYWYYSVFTLIMLVLFELTVCKQRQFNLGTLRNMRRPPYPVYVFREGCWKGVLSRDVVPGDLCSVRQLKAQRGEDDDQILMFCDVLLLRGSCVVNEAMLTGESVPKMKDSVQAAVLADASLASRRLDITDGEHAGHLILGGTRLMQHDAAGAAPLEGVPAPPDGGCTCFVLRTGFSTGQGSLMRTILFSTERVTVDNVETYVFIGILLVFAVAASAYVLVEGLKDDKQDRWKLFLHCTMIITSVVPPELPMELSLAVNTSLARLQKLAVYCTEPYRIPLAGRLDLCCFDKTGTLTSDTYLVRGVALDLAQPSELTAPEALPPRTEYVVAGCHQLVRVSDKVEGDAMEQAAVRAVRWGMTRDGRMIRRSPSAAAGSTSGGLAGPKEQMRILQRFPFSSAAKRMSAVVGLDEIEHAKQQAGEAGPVTATPRLLLVVAKGAPEVIEEHLAEVPAGYTQAYQALMMRGARVLALAYKELPLKTSAAQIKKLQRDEAESGLTFAGFLAMDCPLKDDTASAVAELIASDHRVAIITGDNALTACDVARQLKIIECDYDKILALGASAEQTGPLAWDCLDPTRPLPEALRFSPRDVDGLVRAGSALVVTGPALDRLERDADDFLAALRALAPHVAVFARVSPRHKELVLAALKQAGLRCLMCGDGTNDVGALKQADVGVSIINSPEQEDAVRRARGDLARRIPQAVLDGLSTAERLRAEVQMMESAQEGSSVVQLGDASIASPFTSRTTSIQSTVHIVQQGRCTLVTTIQMYKILALNCLISAYSLSSLHLYGVKQGDTQATLVGLLIAGLFMFIAWAEPLQVLSPQRPVAHIFSRQVVVSLAGQLVVHFASLLAVLHITQPFVDAEAEEMGRDADFKPNVINTAVFLVGLCMQCNVFGANYRGHPFMQSLVENKPFHRVLLATWSLCMLLALEVTFLGDTFELVPLPAKDSYKERLVGVLLANTVCAYGWEIGVRAALGA